VNDALNLEPRLREHLSAVKNPDEVFALAREFVRHIRENEKRNPEQGEVFRHLQDWDGDGPRVTGDSRVLARIVNDALNLEPRLREHLSAAKNPAEVAQLALQIAEHIREIEKEKPTPTEIIRRLRDENRPGPTISGNSSSMREIVNGILGQEVQPRRVLSAAKNRGEVAQLALQIAEHIREIGKEMPTQNEIIRRLRDEDRPGPRVIGAVGSLRAIVRDTLGSGVSTQSRGELSAENQEHRTEIAQLAHAFIDSHHRASQEPPSHAEIVEHLHDMDRPGSAVSGSDDALHTIASEALGEWNSKRMRETSDSEHGVSTSVGAPRAKRLRLADLLNDEPDRDGGLSAGGSGHRGWATAWAPTDRQQHMLTRLGLEPVDTTPNGDCLFEAALTTQHGHTPPEREILALRHDTVAHLLARADDYVPAFAGTRTDYLREVDELARSGVYMSNIADFAPHALAFARNLRVTVLDENGNPAGGADEQGYHGYGPADGVPVTLVRLDQGGGHYLGTRPNTGAGTRGIDSRDVDMTQAHIIHDATPAPPTPQHSGLLVRQLDQGRVETFFPDEPAGLDGDEVQIVRIVEHRLDPVPEMDHAFPWRSPYDPARRVFEPYAAEDGSVHPAVLDRAHKITASIKSGKAALRSTAHNAADPRLPVTAVDKLAAVWPRLEQAVVTEIQRLTRGEPLSSPLIRPGRVGEQHVGPHEQALVDQWGLFLSEEAAALPPDQRPSLLNGQILGVYLGAVLDRPNAVEHWEATYRRFPDYAMGFTSSNRSGRTMSAEGAANSTAFANTAVVFEDAPGGAGTQVRYNQNAINAHFVPFTVRMPNRYGGFSLQPIAALVGLENAFDSQANPDGMIIVDYGKSYLSTFQPWIKPEPE
jgi:hypothetical protein